MNVVQLHAQPTLGGSTIGAAIGVDPYCSPIRLWLEMTGREERAETEAMRWGKVLQPAILDALGGLRDWNLDTEPHEFRDPARRWLVGHPDALGYRHSVDVSRTPPRVVEAKASAWGYDEPPPQYVAQVMTYMYLTGFPQATLATLAGLQLHVADFAYSEHTADTVLGLADEFMRYVWDDEQPPPLGHPDDRHALGIAHPDAAPDKPRRETREIRDARRELIRLLAADKTRKERIEHLRAIITDHMREADTLIDAHDVPVATWKNITSRRLDTKRLRADHPAIAAEYEHESTTRRLDLK